MSNQKNTVKKGTLTLSKMEKLYIEANKYTGCEKCGRTIKYIYFYEQQPFYKCCGYHKLKEK